MASQQKAYSVDTLPSQGFSGPKLGAQTGFLLYFQPFAIIPHIEFS